MLFIFSQLQYNNWFTLICGGFLLLSLVLIFSIVFIFIDGYTRFTWIYPLKAKSDTLNVFLLFKVFVEKQFSLSIKALHSYWGEEY